MPCRTGGDIAKRVLDAMATPAVADRRRMGSREASVGLTPFTPGNAHQVPSS